MSKSFRILVSGVVSISLLSSCMVQPKPLTEEEKFARSSESLGRIFANQEKITGPISIWEAQARAIKYNLDARVKLFETAVAESDLTTAHLDMLPELLANAGYTERSNEPGGRSESLITGATSLDFSKSTEKYAHNNNLAFSWDLLDFGIGYLRAKQRADYVLISKERKRALVHSILKDVRVAYWKAAVAQRMSKKVDYILSKAETALRGAMLGEKEGLIPPLESLNYQKNLLVNINQLQKLQSTLTTAKLELASLINIRPGEDFRVVTDDSEIYYRPRLSFSVKDLETYALSNRPELLEQDYEYRVRKREIQQSWMKILPSVTAKWSYNRDDNEYLFNTSWVELGLNVVLDVLAPVTKAQEAMNNKLRLKMVEAKRDALSVAVLAQVNIAYAQHKAAQERVKLLEKISRVNKRILGSTKHQYDTGVASEQKVVDASVSSLFADLERDNAYIELQENFGQILTSIGMDMIPESIEGDSVAMLASAIEGQVDSLTVKESIEQALKEEREFLLAQKIEEEASEFSNIPRNSKEEIKQTAGERTEISENIMVASVTNDIPLPVRKPSRFFRYTTASSTFTARQYGAEALPPAQREKHYYVSYRSHKEKQPKLSKEQTAIKIAAVPVPKPKPKAKLSKKLKKKKPIKSNVQHAKFTAPRPHKKPKAKYSRLEKGYRLEIEKYESASDADYALYIVQKRIPRSYAIEKMGIARESNGQYSAYIIFEKKSNYKHAKRILKRFRSLKI